MKSDCEAGRSRAREIYHDRSKQGEVNLKYADEEQPAYQK